jgi:DNA-binding Lrp family transcriptional regulator
MSIQFLNTAGLDLAMEEEIVRLLRELGPVPVYRLARELRATYGTAQYYVDRLVRRGVAYTVRVGARRYVALSGQDWLGAVAVGDVLEELSAALRRAKVGSRTPLHEALKKLGQTSPSVAEALTLIATALHRQT